MTVVADVSAIAKLFSGEADSDRVAEQRGPFALASLTRVEAASAVWMKSRVGALPVRRVDSSCNRFRVFDQRLGDAAARAGFSVVGPDSY